MALIPPVEHLKTAAQIHLAAPRIGEDQIHRAAPLIGVDRIHQVAPHIAEDRIHLAEIIPDLDQGHPPVRDDLAAVEIVQLENQLIVSTLLQVAGVYIFNHF